MSYRIGHPLRWRGRIVYRTSLLSYLVYTGFSRDGPKAILHREPSFQVRLRLLWPLGMESMAFWKSASDIWPESWRRFAARIWPAINCSSGLRFSRNRAQRSAGSGWQAASVATSAVAAAITASTFLIVSSAFSALGWGHQMLDCRSVKERNITNGFQYCRTALFF